MSADIVVIDTETGGLVEQHHPLLSISMLAVRASDLKELRRFHLKILPPEGTLLELTHDTDPAIKMPRVYALEDVNGTRYPCDTRGVPNDPSLHENMRISAGAARVNGFTWTSWSETGLRKEDADDLFSEFIRTYCRSKPMPVAHNAQFDKKFLFFHLPKSHDLLGEPWLCTMTKLREWRKKTGVAGNAKLSDLAELANNDPTTPAYQSLNLKTGGTVMDSAHDALADTITCHAGLIWLTAKLAHPTPSVGR